MMESITDRLLQIWKSELPEEETINKIVIVPVEGSDTKIAGVYFLDEKKNKKKNNNGKLQK